MFNLFKKKPLSRKERSIKFLEKKGVKVNYNLPNIESDDETTIRTPKEIAQRVTILAVTNLVAFSAITSEQAIEYLKSHKLWQYVTPDEIKFLNHPTDERKNQESWKCEGIWTLLWALKIVDELDYPNTMCDLNEIPIEQYPTQPGKDPNIFIDKSHTIRSKKEILDANDLYYRFDWACVDARLNNHELNVHPGVVYERHYALNWLINYLDLDWDDVSCDT
ncbi:DUF4272 domain-containing protein [Psychroserpens sp. SPM9]|uniref:DUF4272 domain-containing protein n=1 Tax=Psychroserpens sp. SPM9 TaxID=2975598 RepID=UPI0021A2CBA3|nr:DUF4272 domain-containing protein [Psychroserpens sp. SPM9]MDG5493007.1 DUF4272 domain-containing protein [Psychroserpens sp. SPM9]